MVVLPQHDHNIYPSARNPAQQVVTAGELNTYDVLNAQHLVLVEALFLHLETRFLSWASWKKPPHHREDDEDQRSWVNTVFVDRTANKIQIKQAVEKMYNVTVESVNTMVAPGKAKTRYTKTGVVSGSGCSKKAVVTLKKGDAIDFYGNI